MKKFLLLIPAAFLIVGFTINHVMDQKMKSFLDQIKLSENNANNMIFSNISGPSFYLSNTAQLKAIATGDRSAIVETVGKYAKEYAASKEFLEKYHNYKEMKKPAPPEKPKSMDEMKEEQRKAIKEGIENMEKLVNQMPDQKEAFEENIKMFKQQLKDIDDPDNPMYNSNMEGIMQQGYDQQIEVYNQRLAELDNEYPDNNPKPMIKKWLEKFLEETDDIDFNAQVVDGQYGKKVFAKQEYERKSSLWKLCYRAGKETTNACRNFAQNWLKEL